MHSSCPVSDCTLCALQLPKLVDSFRLRNEVQRVLTKHRRGSKHAALVGGEAKAADAGDEQLAVLLSWCQAVCSTFNLNVLNFRTSFADARGMCLLVRIT